MDNCRGLQGMQRITRYAEDYKVFLYFPHSLCVSCITLYHLVSYPHELSPVMYCIPLYPLYSHELSLVAVFPVMYCIPCILMNYPLWLYPPVPYCIPLYPLYPHELSLLAVFPWNVLYPIVSLVSS